ncbi:Tm-1-like ATP-binding domain-containing protein [Streptomyces sp. Amel2xB2]|uniref:Tm-1-like ATP-binding domain-containing protein n=1 Tax=Streptomyces sp. Amel2xB2 TaxID=1305829 RepID=UPI000DBA610E|nr:Tm-1-like ATP-binding domain-containing protein [Streptomyces sp. Amel2xB2]
MLFGSLDTKDREYAFVRDLLVEQGLDVVLVDTGVLGTPALTADVTADAVAEAAGTSLRALRARGERGHALTAMAAGARAVAEDLYARGRLSGALALGGSGGSSIAATVLQALPLGVPKLLVSTMAAGDVSAYVGTSDVTLMYSVVDVAGVNSVSRQVLANAAGAIAGMATAYDARRAAAAAPEDKPLVAATMFGVTTPAVDTARRRLEQLGYEVLVFHATGSGGRTMESLVADGHLAGVLDLTTTEIADEVGGGVLSAGPDRLTAAAAAGVPQVVSLGALDMVNFGPASTVPQRFEGRTLLVHNEAVTLMRTNAAECAEIGAVLGTKLAASTGPAALFVPRGGFSAVDAPDGPFWDPEADAACIGAALDALDGSAVEIVDTERNVNDTEFAESAADRLHRLIQRERHEP